MNEILTYIVDSFTNEAFKGNPAGVCMLDTEISEHLMQSIAMELGLSETAFIRRFNESDTYGIRFFSPKMEIPLCGHATLASSKVIFNTNKDIEQITFVNKDNLKLPIKKSGNSIIMYFPIYETIPANAPSSLLRALGLKSVVNTAFNVETNILLLEIEKSTNLNELNPDFNALYHSHNEISGVLVTCRSDRKNYDFESRYFWPWSGTNEDPVTGGTHTFLTKYWGDKIGKSKLNAYQCSERGGYMELELIDKNTMSIKSEAKIILKGNIYL